MSHRHLSSVVLGILVMTLLLCVGVLADDAATTSSDSGVDRYDDGESRDSSPRQRSSSLRVEALEPGRSVDDLREAVLGFQCPDPKCVGTGAACPSGAAVWASGSFITELTPAALAHGGLRLQLSLCCNFTFKEDFIRKAAPSPSSSAYRYRTSKKHVAQQHEDDQKASDDAEMMKNQRFDRFVRVMLSQFPAKVQDNARLLFRRQDASAHASLASIELRTSPVTADLARELVQLLRATPSSTAALPGGLDADDGATLDLEALGRPGSSGSSSSGRAIGNGGDEDVDGWVLHVSNAELDCKCPRTLRAAPVVIGRSESAPLGLSLDGADKVCRDAPHSEDASIKVDRTWSHDVRLAFDDPETLRPYAVVTWTVAPVARPNDAHTIVSRVGVRLHNIPRDVPYRVTARAAHGGAFATLEGIVGWSYQAHFTFIRHDLRDPLVVLGREAIVPVDVSVDGVSLAAANCSDLGLRYDGDECLTERRALLMQYLKCNVPHRLASSGVDTVVVTLPRAGETRVACSVKNELGACALAGGRIALNSVRIAGIASFERVICTRGTSLSAEATGLPPRLTQAAIATTPTASDGADRGAEGRPTPAWLDTRWVCNAPDGSLEAAQDGPPLYNETAEASNDIEVPDSGLDCRFVVRATEALVTSHLLPTSPRELTELVRLASKFADVDLPEIQVFNMTTKDINVRIPAPTATGTWHGNSIITFERSSANPGVVKNLPISKALVTHVKWVNSVKPCVGHEFNVPVMVKWAKPTHIELCEHRWYNDRCIQIAANFPAKDEEANFTIVNETGSVPDGAFLKYTGVNTRLLCDTPNGTSTIVEYRVWNPAGELRKRCVMQRCSEMPSPSFPESMSRRIVFGPVMKVEANADFDSSRFFGTWTASNPEVVFDDPHALATTARGLPPGKTLIIFTLDAIGEQARPDGICPTRKVLISVISESAECPVGPLRSCTDSVTVPYFNLAPAVDRAAAPESARVSMSSFTVACSDASLAASIDVNGTLTVSGMRPGTYHTCTVSAITEALGEATHCTVTVERVRPVVAMSIAARRFWIGNGLLPVTVTANFSGRENAPAGEGRPKLVLAGRLHAAVRSLGEVRDRLVTSRNVSLAPVNLSDESPPRDFTVDDSGVHHALARGLFDVTVEEGTTVTLTYELLDPLCGPSNVTHQIWALQAGVAVSEIVTCDSRAPLVGVGLPTWLDGWEREVVPEWSIAVVDRPGASQSLRRDRYLRTVWHTPDSPYIVNASHTVASIAGLPFGNTTVRFTLALVDDRSVSSSATAVVVAASENLPPHAGVLYTTLSKIELDIANEASVPSVAPSGFSPARRPELRRFDRGHVFLYHLYRGQYKLAYRPNPVTMPQRLCPKGRHSMQSAIVQRVALRVVTGWDRDASECDVYRGTASFTMYVLAAHPDGTFSVPPAGLALETDGDALRRLLAGANAQHQAKQWWLRDTVEWMTEPLSADEALSALHGRGVVALGDNHTATTGFALRITPRLIDRDAYLSADELEAAPIDDLRVPVAAIHGLAEREDVELKHTTFVKTVRLNGTVLEGLRANASRVLDTTDELVAAGRAAVPLDLLRPLRNASTAESIGRLTSLMGISDSPHCVAVKKKMRDESSARWRPALASLGGWFHAAPQPLRRVVTSCRAGDDAAHSVVNLALVDNETFVIPSDLELHLLVPKRALCGLAAKPPSLPSRSDALNPRSVVDFGRMLVRKTPLHIEQTRDSVKQCIVAASVSPIDGVVAGGYIADDALLTTDKNSSSATPAASVRHPLAVSRADGKVNDYDLSFRGNASVAACIRRLRPTLEVRGRKSVRLRVASCPDLQLGSGDESNVTLLLDFPGTPTYDGVTRRELRLKLTIAGSRAIVTPYLRRSFATSVDGSLAPDRDGVAVAATGADGALEARIQSHLLNPDEGLEEVKSPEDTAEVRHISEAHLKSGLLVLRVALEGDTWHPDAGLAGASGFNTAMASGFGLLEDDADPVRDYHQRQLRERWFGHLVGLAGLVRFTDALLKPANVVRINDTVIDLLVPECSAAPRLCRRVPFQAAGSPVDTPVPFFVPGICTECPGCIRATPAFVVRPDLGGMSVFVPGALSHTSAPAPAPAVSGPKGASDGAPKPSSEGTAAEAAAVVQTWRRLVAYDALEVLPGAIQLRSEHHAWAPTSLLYNTGSTARSSSISAVVVTRDNIVRARYAPVAVNGDGSALTLAREVSLDDENENVTAKLPTADRDNGTTDDADAEDAEGAEAGALAERLLLVVVAMPAGFDVRPSPPTNDLSAMIDAASHRRGQLLATSVDLVSPVVQQVPFAIATQPPTESVILRVAAAAAHGYLAFLATESVCLMSGSTSYSRQHFGPSSAASRVMGVISFASMLLVPMRSPLAALVMVLGWSIVYSARGISWLALELFAVHIALMAAAP